MDNSGAGGDQNKGRNLGFTKGRCFD